MRREHEKFLPARGALCRGMTQGNVAYRLFEVLAHEVSSDRSDLSLFGYPPAFRPPGFSAFRLSGFSGMEVETVIGWCARLAMTLSPV